MNYKIEELEDGLVIRNMKDFDPKDIFECGQAFRWKLEEDGSYTALAYGKLINVLKDGQDILFRNTNLDDFNNVWYNYFDLGTNYSKIKEELSKDDEILRTATKFGSGIRILNQDAFETIISFIISANNQIPRIKKSIELISREYGKYITSYNGEEYYSFPSAETLSKVEISDLREKAKVGFRDERIIKTSEEIASGNFNIEEIFRLTRDEGKEKLMLLPGVGPKVSDCILLFAYGKGDAFPVDVWVKRVMEYFYLKEETNVKKIGAKGKELFGEKAGYAQQYLFYYARELNIGK